MVGMIRTVAVVLLALTGAGAAHAQPGGTIFGCVDESGRRYYTNIKSDTDGKKCSVVQKEVSVLPAPPGSSASPRTNSPGAGARVDPSTQRNRDEARRRILQEELTGAESRLAEARQKLVEQEGIRDGSERNYQRVLERLKPFQEEVARQEQNVSELKREISLLR